MSEVEHQTFLIIMIVAARLRRLLTRRGDWCVGLEAWVTPGPGRVGFLLDGHLFLAPIVCRAVVATQIAYDWVNAARDFPSVGMARSEFRSERRGEGLNGWRKRGHLAVPREREREGKAPRAASRECNGPWNDALPNIRGLACLASSLEIFRRENTLIVVRSDLYRKCFRDRE